jgi:hypothetical protein
MTTNDSAIVKAAQRLDINVSVTLNTLGLAGPGESVSACVLQGGRNGLTVSGALSRRNYRLHFSS